MTRPKYPEIPLIIKGKKSECNYFERLRNVGDIPEMHEKNCVSAGSQPGFLKTEFVEGLFFKTLSTKCFIEVVGSTSELISEFGNEELSKLLINKIVAPDLFISVKAHTSNPDLTIYGELYCNTEKFPVGNRYLM